VGLTAALFVIEVCATVGAQAPAVAPANYLHRQRQQHLLTQHVRQKKPFSFEKPYFRVIFLQPSLFRFHALGQRAIKEVKRSADFLYHRFQAASAHQFDLGLDFPRDPYLAVQKLRGGVHLQRLDLLDFRRLVIDAARHVALPDRDLADGKVLNVKEHVFSASGAHAHAFFIIESLACQVKESAWFGPEMRFLSVTGQPGVRLDFPPPWRTAALASRDTPPSSHFHSPPPPCRTSLAHRGSGPLSRRQNRCPRTLRCAP